MAVPKGKRAPKGKPGRVSRYHPDYVPVAAEFMARIGLIDKDIAAKLGVPERTFTRWKSDHAELREALTRGKEEPNEKVISALYKEALGYMQEEYVQTRDSAGTVVSTSLSKRWMRPSTGAMAFWLKNRDSQNWRDKWELTHTVDEPLEKFAAAMKEFRFGNDSGQGE